MPCNDSAVCGSVRIRVDLQALAWKESLAQFGRWMSRLTDNVHEHDCDAFMARGQGVVDILPRRAAHHVLQYVDREHCMWASSVRENVLPITDIIRD